MYLANIVSERDHFAFNHGRLATNHNGMNIIMCSHNFGQRTEGKQKDERSGRCHKERGKKKG